jgi:hypothetical protein
MVQSVKYLADSWLPLCNFSPHRLLQKGTEVSELCTGVSFPETDLVVGLGIKVALTCMQCSTVFGADVLLRFSFT